MIIKIKHTWAIFKTNIIQNKWLYPRLFNPKLLDPWSNLDEADKASTDYAYNLSVCRSRYRDSIFPPLSLSLSTWFSTLEYHFENSS